MRDKNFTTPKLCSYDNDLSKNWYVYLYYTDSETDTKKQFRYKLGINRLKTVKERKTEAQGIISALLYKLHNGWSPFTDTTDDKYRQITIIEALDDILSLKKTSVKSSSYRTYNDQINKLKKWLNINKYNFIFAENFTSQLAQRYFDYLLKNTNICGKTYNNYLTTTKLFFEDMRKHKKIKRNPFYDIKQIQQDKGKNTTYSVKEQELLEKVMYSENRDFFYSTRFIKYGFFRRTELIALQVKHINWENKTIIIPSASAKTRVQDSVTISHTLEKFIIEMGILNLNPEMYIFGKNFAPCFEKIDNADRFSAVQRYFNRKLNIKPECTFYSWKHTGAVELYNIVKDPYIVMRQCRHSNIQTTMIYLRSLGCGVNEKVREW